MNALDDLTLGTAQLTHNMMAFDRGLRDLARRYEDCLDLIDADPITFGAGHYVLYPTSDPSERFTIEEEYTGTDWTDPERVPTWWTWTHEKRTLNLRAGSQWTTLKEGEVPSHRFTDLLHLAHVWAETIHTHVPQGDATQIGRDPHGSSLTIC